MDPNRSQWNERHQALRKALARPDELPNAIDLFLVQHAPLHAPGVSGTQGWNLEEEVWTDLSDAVFRCVPPGEEHSIAWCYWHLARIEDITMNLLVAGSDQVFTQADWQQRLHAPFADTGNLISPEDVLALSQQVEMNTLREYRSAVGLRTRQIVQQLNPADIKRKTPSERLQRGLDEGAIAPYATGLIEYWGGLTVAGLLLMPPTRHNLFHLSECLTLKRKAQKSLRSK